MQNNHMSVQPSQPAPPPNNAYNPNPNSNASPSRRPSDIPERVFVNNNAYNTSNAPPRMSLDSQSTYLSQPKPGLQSQGGFARPNMQTIGGMPSQQRPTSEFGMLNPSGNRPIAATMPTNQSGFGDNTSNMPIAYIPPSQPSSPSNSGHEDNRRVSSSGARPRSRGNTNLDARNRFTVVNADDSMGRGSHQPNNYTSALEEKKKLKAQREEEDRKIALAAAADTAEPVPESVQATFGSNWMSEEEEKRRMYEQRQLYEEATRAARETQQRAPPSPPPPEPRIPPSLQVRPVFCQLC